MANADPSTPRTVVPINASPLLTSTFGRGQITDLRHDVAACVEASGVTGQRLDDFVLAVNELITNAVRHGGGQGQVRIWREGDVLFCEVTDSGTGMVPERLDNRERPAPNVAGGWGLWLAEQLSDELLVRSGPDGTTVRISATVGSQRPAGGPAQPA